MLNEQIALEIMENIFFKYGNTPSFLAPERGDIFISHLFYVLFGQFVAWMQKEGILHLSSFTEF